MRPAATQGSRRTTLLPLRPNTRRAIAHSTTRVHARIQWRPRQREQLRCRASSLDSDPTKVAEWLNVAFPHNTGFRDESDRALSEALNEICNMTLSAMLREDESEILSVQTELYALGAFFSNQGNRKAAVMMYVLHQLCAHEVPEIADGLDGLYREAFLKIGAMIEDSGWELTREGQEETDAAET